MLRQKRMDQSRKRNPQEVPKAQPAPVRVVEEPPKPRMKFHELPEDVRFYLIEIYPFGGKLFFTGVMENGQTLNVIALDLTREIYFVLKGDSEGKMGPQYLKKAEE